jgi:hypothetical protein
VSPGGARRGLTCRLAVLALARRGLVRPSACGRWLPVWLPGISLATLTSWWLKAPTRPANGPTSPGGAGAPAVMTASRYGYGCRSRRAGLAPADSGVRAGPAQIECSSPEGPPRLMPR